MLDIFLISIGMGMVAAGFALLLTLISIGGIRVLLKPLKKIFSGYEPSWKKEDKASILLGLAGGLFLTHFFYGTRYALLVFFMGLSAGALLSKFIFSIHISAEEQAKKRQLAIFFEAVELYMRGGRNMKQAIAAAQNLTPSLRKAVQKCLTYWPKSPVKALEEFRKEVNIPEANILVSLLIRIERSGIIGMEGVIQRDAHNIEKLRDMAARKTIYNRPMYFMMYRLLPTVTVLGMLIGSLYYRLNLTLEAVGIKF